MSTNINWKQQLALALPAGISMAACALALLAGMTLAGCGPSNNGGELPGQPEIFSFGFPCGHGLGEAEGQQPDGCGEDLDGAAAGP
jgi:hypothetical protein